MPTTKNARAGPTNTKDPTPGIPPRQTRCLYILPASPIGDDEFHDTTEYMVNNKEDRITYLSSRLLSIPDRPMDMYNISATLLQIVHLKSMPLAAKEAIRAIAYIIDDHAALEITEAILPHIVAPAPATERITNEVIKALAPHMANLLHTSQSITNTSDTLKTNQTALSELSHSLNNQVEHIKSSHTTAKNNTDNGHLTTTNEDIKDIKNAIDQIIPAINFESATSRMVQRQQRSVGEPSEREHYSLYC